MILLRNKRVAMLPVFPPPDAPKPPSPWSSILRSRTTCDNIAEGKIVRSKRSRRSRTVLPKYRINDVMHFT